MLTLDQVKLLENKVESLIELVKTLCGERDALRDVLQKKDKEIAELSAKVNAYETEQAKIEERVVNALNQLDVFQNSVASAKALLSQTNVADNVDHVPSTQQSPVENSTDEYVNEANIAPSASTEEKNSIEDVSPSGHQEAQSNQQSSASENEEEQKKDESEEDIDKQMDIF